jgi:hypothetical protein
MTITITVSQSRTLAGCRTPTPNPNPNPGQAASATFDLGAISSYRLATLPPSAPLLSSSYHYWRCLMAGHQSAEASAQCGYGYLLGSRSATHQLLQLGRPCAAALGSCNSMWWRLRPYVMEAATLCDAGCDSM